MSKIAAATVRDLIIDIIRALAIIFMIIWHSLMWFSNTHCYHEEVCSFAQTLLWQGVYHSSPIPVVDFLNTNLLFQN